MSEMSSIIEHIKELARCCFAIITLMKPRIIFIHGNQAMSWGFAWTPWFKAEVERLGFETYFQTMPDSIIARAEYWLPFLQNYAQAGENDVLVGWSSGAVAAMRYAETHKIKGSVLISPCYTDLDDDLEKQSGYYNNPWQWKVIKANQEKIALIYGEDDPFIPQAEFEFIADNLQPEVLKVSGGKHFIEKRELPELLKYIRQNY
jgi:predicted alpha/beta hydrolase family esterase